MSGPLDASLLRKAKPSNTDVLAFDLPAMQACRSSGIPFVTPSDFYPPAEFRQTFERVIHQVETLFEQVDRQYAQDITYPHALKSNIYSFICYFSDLYYLSGLAKSIRHRYSSTQVITTEREEIAVKQWQSPMDPHIFGNQVFRKTNATTYNLKHLWKLLDRPPVLSFPQSAEDRIGQNFLIQFQRRYAYLLRPKNWSTLFLKLRHAVRAGKNIRGDKRVIWCIQDGYEVAPLKKYMPEFTFVSPISELKDTASNLWRCDTTPFYEYALAPLGEIFPEWTTEIGALLQDYHEGVVCLIPAVMEMIAVQMAADQPHCAFYSIGAGIPLDGLYAWILNQRRVPIYSFQHGYSCNLYYTAPFNKYWEFNTDVDQTNIFVSQREVELRMERELRPSQCVHKEIAGGSIRLFEWHEAHRKQTERPGNGRILYVQGRYPSEMWKNLFCSEGEDIIFEKHERLFEAVSSYGLPLDIKLYPGIGKLYAPYFQRFARRYSLRDVRFLYSQPAERVAPDYSLIIVDYIGTALNAFFMLLDRPIIYYLSERELVNPAISEEFCKRHYVVHDGKGLHRLLQLFKQGTLPSNYRTEYVDKFIYPVDGVSPGARIANIVRNYSSTEAKERI